MNFKSKAFCNLPPVKRIMLRTIKDSSGCWIYTGAKVGKIKGVNTHGRIKIKGKNTLVHRFMWETFVGEIPEGKCVLHKCIGHPECWNPDHLYLGTHIENAMDSSRQGRFSHAGTHNGNSKINSSIANVIRYSPETVTSRSLAIKYRITEGNVRKIRRNELWQET